MANDREVLKVVWEGKIPVKFVAEEERDLEDQQSYFLLIPRVSYLPLVTDKVKKHFQRYIEDEENVWYSYNETPLKWHFPIGLLFDLLVTDEVLPMQINVHFKKFPEDILFRCPSK
jgi:autophagy-related protein 5